MKQICECKGMYSCRQPNSIGVKSFNLRIGWSWVLFLYEYLLQIYVRYGKIVHHFKDCTVAMEVTEVVVKEDCKEELVYSTKIKIYPKTLVDIDILFHAFPDSLEYICYAQIMKLLI